MWNVFCPRVENPKDLVSLKRILLYKKRAQMTYTYLKMHGIVAVWQ
jgi:hypothetical protein